MPARAPLAWLQLSHGRVKLIVAVAGVVVAVLLMLMQLGFMQAAFQSALIVPRQIDADLVVISPQTQAMFRTAQFPHVLLYRMPSVPGVESVRAIGRRPDPEPDVSVADAVAERIRRSDL